MASKDPEDIFNTETEDGTFAMQRRKSRRVSFAETTEVHIFDRDEDNETPPDPRPSSEDRDAVGIGLNGTNENEDIMELLRSREDGDVETDDEDEHVAMRRSFFRPLESPSPVSTFGSATSNDDDNFFGPVSADFIRPGRLSGSAVSDENRDITMDSTAFSMHFRSLANSETGREFKTPTGFSLVSEEKTPDTDITLRNSGNLMTRTGHEKMVPRSSFHINRKVDGFHSNDMTIEAENPYKYDYGRLSPELEALWAEVRDVETPSLLNDTEGLGSATYTRKENMVPAVSPNRPEHLDLRESCSTGVGSSISVLKTSSQMVYSDHIKIDDANTDVQIPPIDQRAHDLTHKDDFTDVKSSPSGRIGTPDVVTQQILESDSMQELSHGQDKNMAYVKDHDVPSVQTNIATPQSDRLIKKQNTHASDGLSNISPKSFHMYDVNNSSILKRKLGDMVHGADNASEIELLQPSPKVQRTLNCMSESAKEHPMETNEVAAEAGGSNLTPRHWTDVFSGFCEATKQLLPPNINGFDLRMLAWKLENILVQLQKVQTYEILCSGIFFKNSYKLIGYQNKRILDIRMLHLRTMFAKARSELLTSTRQKLLSQVQSLHSGIKESEKLKSKCWQCQFLPEQLHTHGRRSESHAVELDANDAVAQDKIATMRQALEVSEQKIKMLRESFHDLLKLEGDSSSFETLALMKNHLKKRISSQHLRWELQSWKVEHLESKNKKHVVLSYGEFFFQRFELSGRPISNVRVSNRLNESKILKCFPNIDALAAFKFILSDGIHLKCVHQRASVQATQRTSTLFHNMMDVIEEVQTARMELRNLTHSSFCSPSSQQLDLQLWFTDFNSGRRLGIRLDVTCLSRGVYPSEVQPDEIKDGAAATQSCFPPGLLVDTRAAAECLKGGYTRILRLCHCISKVVEANRCKNQEGSVINMFGCS